MRSREACTLPYFPRIYQDESLYSVLARYHRHVGGGSPKQTLCDLFGSPNVIASTDLQGHLGALASRLPPSWALSADRLLAQFTLFPYLLAFQPAPVRERVARAAVEGSLSGVHLLIGLASSKYRVKFLRFCPECLQDMRRDVGEYYWRRSHQVAGVLICLEHGCSLKESGVPAPLGNRHAFIAATARNCVDGRIVAPAGLAADDAVRRIAERCVATLQSPPAPRDPREWVANYRRVLISAGMASAQGRVDQTAVEAGIRELLGGALLPLLGEIGVQDLTMLPQIVRSRQRAHHPLLHLLYQDFLAHLAPRQPFGAGPWPCLNPLASHQGESLIESVALHRNHGALVGTFECARCGYAYTRNISPKTGAVGRVRALRFGEFFDSELRRLCGPRARIREVARRLHVDARTVRLRAARLGLNVSWKPAQVAAHSPVNVTGHREAWLSLRKSRRDAGRKELAGLAPAIYTWLYRHDRRWLKAHQPPLKRSPMVAGPDWTELDAEWDRLIGQLAELIRNADPPRKVTLAEISRQSIDPEWLPNHLKHLPRARLALDRLRDTTASFQVRRVMWAAKHLAGAGVPVVAWRIARRAGLGSNLAPEVREAMLRAVSSTGMAS